MPGEHVGSARIGSERFVVELERAAFTCAGRSDLAARVEWVASTRGDGVGYDVLSFDLSDSAKYIEVKTTNGSIACPFYVTASELAASVHHGPAFLLYRVFEFRTSPKLYTLLGALSSHLRLVPTQYRDHR